MPDSHHPFEPAAPGGRRTLTRATANASSPAHWPAQRSQSPLMKAPRAGTQQRRIGTSLQGRIGRPKGDALGIVINRPLFLAKTPRETHKPIRGQTRSNDQAREPFKRQRPGYALSG